MLSCALALRLREAIGNIRNRMRFSKLFKDMPPVVVLTLLAVGLMLIELSGGLLVNLFQTIRAFLFDASK
jgi:hypothetical protein